jgi:hypothetical protein
LHPAQARGDWEPAELLLRRSLRLRPADPPALARFAGVLQHRRRSLDRVLTGFLTAVWPLVDLFFSCFTVFDQLFYAAWPRYGLFFYRCLTANLISFLPAL